jgi:hypothetical protein
MLYHFGVSNTLSQQILANFDNHVTIDLAQKASNLESFVSNALHIYEGLGLAIPWIHSLIDYEVSGITAGK